MLWYQKIKNAITLQAESYAPFFASQSARVESLLTAASALPSSVREYERYAAPNGVTDKAYTDYGDKATETNADSAMSRILSLQNDLQNLDEMFLKAMEPLFTARL